MSRFKIAAVGLAAMLTVALLPSVPSAAASISVLTFGAAPAGAPVTVSDFLQASLSGVATFYAPSSTTGVTCAGSTLTDSLLGNAPAPGTAGTKVTSLIFNTCSPSIPGVTGVLSVTFNNLPYLQTFSDTSTPFPVVTQPMAGPIQVSIVETVPGTTITCLFQSGPPLIGSYNNTTPPHSISFVNRPFNLISGPGGACGGGVDLFSAVYAPFKDISKPGVNLVWVN